MIVRLLIGFFTVLMALAPLDGFSQRNPMNQEKLLQKINKIRSKGCKCGYKKMKPVPALIWDDTLEKSAFAHAKDMSRKRYFSHYSKSGKDVGDRVEDLGYVWIFVGENIAEGQKTVDDVFEDWLKSESHCQMIMNPDMKEFGMARYKEKWVQHFGTALPKGKRLKKSRT